MSTFSYELGYALGVVAREIRNALQTPHYLSCPEPDDEKWPYVPTQQELDAVPAIVRKGVDLKQWYDENVHDTKRRRPRKKANAPKQ